ncbi:MAG: dockerin type I repeat-containing protein [Prevotella sp.]|nr:dockerin type I repeat-containing protein [Prevotella sp.]
MKKNLLIGFLCAVGTMFSTGAMALEQKNGVYQIGTKQDLVEFSALVNGGEQAANAVLTEDLNMDSVVFTPIGNVSTPYKGTFDGQEHVISNLYINLPEQEYVGLFGVLNDGAYIKNLIMDAFCEVDGLRFVGAFAGGTNGAGVVTFENCGNAGFVGAAEQNAAGIIGVSMKGECGIRLIRCFNVGSVAGGWESAALCGWVGNSGSEITNCYNAGWVSGLDGNNSLWRNGSGKGTGNFDSYDYQGDLISDNPLDLESGSVAYTMNGNLSENVIWYQNLGTDAFPVPFASHGVVYAVGELNCDGTSKSGDTSFSNTNESKRDPHQFSNGICTVCGDIDPAFLPVSDGYYTISTADDLAWFAALVNHGHKNVSARLTADIDFTGYTKQDVMIGGDAYAADENDDKMAFEGGTFDGQGHTITIDYNVSYDGVALFKVVRDATIKNLVVEGSIESTQRFIGGLGYVSRGTSTFENIVVDVDINGSFVGDATDGGLFAVCHEHATFRNCAFIGTMIAPDSEGSAGIIGYAHGSVETIIENCYVAAEEMVLTGNSTVLARHVDTRKNCFYTDNIFLFDDQATVVSVEDVASGKLCYLINMEGQLDGWRQNIGQDAYPVPFADHAVVYANGSAYCDGTLKNDVAYSNTNGSVVRDPHNYQNDICTACGSRIIRNVDQLLALANDINSGAETRFITVDLLADIDLKGINYTGIGTRFNEDTGEVNDNGDPVMRDVKRPFYGYFDGHGHKISHMLIDVMDEGNKGFIGFIQAGSTVKNLLVDNTCEIYSIGWSAGIVGASTGKGVLTIENCGNEAMVNVGADGANGAGILGVNDLSGAEVHIINCYNTGDIVGQRECGGISGWLGDNFIVENCYNSGIVSPEAVDGIRTFARYNGGDNDPRFVNCFEVMGSQVTPAEAADLASGKLCYDINQGAGETVYYQTLGKDKHPVLDATHLTVVKKGDNYVNESSTVKKGDVNGDGAVDVADISAIISTMAGSDEYTSADVNGDGAVDVADISNVISIMAENSRRQKTIE